MLETIAGYDSWKLASPYDGADDVDPADDAARHRTWCLACDIEANGSHPEGWHDVKPWFSSDLATGALAIGFSDLPTHCGTCPGCHAEGY